MTDSSPPIADHERDAALVFISYSRRDRARADPLVAALERLGLDVWIDRTDIPFTADFLREIEEAIARCSLFVFLMSADSLTSRMCQMELDHAVKLGKRMAPVVLQDARLLPPLPDTLATLNFIDLDDEERTAREVERALSFDQGYLHRHTWLVLRARRWQTQGRHGSDLLRGAELIEAEEWLSTAPTHEPPPTAAQCELIARSRRAANVRRLATAVGVVAFVVGVVAWIRTSQRAESHRAVQALTAAAKQIDAELEGQGQPDAIGKARQAARESITRFGFILPPVKGMVLRALGRSLEIARFERPGPQIQDLRANHDGSRTVAAFRGSSDGNTYAVGDPLVAVATMDDPGNWATIAAPVAADRIELCPGGDCVVLRDAEASIVSILDTDGRPLPLRLPSGEPPLAVDVSRSAGIAVVATTKALMVTPLGDHRWARVPLPGTPRSVTLQPGSAQRCLVVSLSGTAVIVDLRSRDVHRLPKLVLETPFAFGRDGDVYWTRAAGELMRYSASRGGTELLARLGPQRIARIATDARSGDIAATADTEGLAWLVSSEGAPMLPGPVYVGVQPSVAFASDGARLIAASYVDATIRMIDVRRQTTRVARVQMEQPVASLSFCGDGDTLLVAGQSGSMAVVDARNGTTVSRWAIPTADPKASCAAGDRAIVVSGGTVSSYGLADGALRLRWTSPEQSRFNAMAIGDRGSIYASAGQSLYRLGPQGTVSKIAEVDTGDIHRVAVAESHDRFIVGSSGAGHIQIGRLSTGAMLGAPIRGHLGIVLDLAADSRSERFASGGTVGSGNLTPLSLWSFEGVRIGGNAAHLTLTTAVAFDPSSRFLVTGGSDGRARMWDPELLEMGFALTNHDRGAIVTAVAASVNGRVATGGSNQVVEIHDLRDDRLLRMLDSFAAAVGDRPSDTD